jgi:sterol desaturase/sphingolipid hydroxylase (fatty acid hydroxylase superfamily)
MGLSAVRRHSAQEEAVDVNFAVHLPVIDRLFGTYYLPREAWPTAYGIAGDPVPDGYLRQLVFPFSSKESPVERATRQT